MKFADRKIKTLLLAVAIFFIDLYLNSFLINEVLLLKQLVYI